RGEVAKLLASVRAFPERAHLVGAYALGKAQRIIALLREAGWDGDILVDQGAADQFLHLLKPEALAGAIAETRTPGIFRMQPGYDHSYFFVASFMEDHVAWHAERL
ncbi:MAG: hypothetical protein AAFZ09_15670, partial [Pseudomonadota bacterium]